ncbi:putative ADP-ribosylation factor GTPase-activating protein AGD14 isoform X2 [Tasmannia lanceolata]|uniref:putative ADP-ribosylation factor GTPase-activating protein AGD14 isoform X2 n=1 Tax=Tasmannia lanceolata TaxID=3420 RepID=UPI0040636775
MSSRKEEERNEKIIRGLMKLPPNRKCINCNSLGPQYVCTNFWTFICIACSGIHREFTHRVKSVSMSKFTSQEVDSLQRGGNQRAREIFLRDWDTQRSRLPNSRIREFIKNVYVDKKYAGGKMHDKPPRDMQNEKIHEDDTRRASSYHSYSQSPPYEHQYEDRRYGKQTGVLSRKPGSDRGHYEGKISSFIYSSSHLREHIFEDRFADDGSGTRVSDYSVSSAGDPFRFDAQSPNFQRDTGFSSPPLHPVRDILVEDARRQTISNVPFSSNEGWATFDLPQHATSTPAIKHNPTVIMPTGDGLPKGNLEALSSINNIVQWPSIQTSTAHAPFASMSDQWHESVHEVQAPNGPTSSQLWKAFDDSTGNLSEASFEGLLQGNEPQFPAHMPPLPDIPSTSGDQFKSSNISEGLSKEGFQSSTIENRVPVHSIPFDSVAPNSTFPPSLPPSMGGMLSHTHERKSTNPFDLPYESNLEPSNMFLDMSSLQAALPNSSVPAFLGGLTQPWFSPSSVTPYIPSVPQGGLAYMSGQAPSSQLPNISSQGPVASLGGNPFA